MTPRTSPGGLALIAVSSLFFGSIAVIARSLHGSVGSSQLVVIRHLTALVGLIIFFVTTSHRPVFKRPVLLLLRGLFGGTAVLLYFFALERLGPAPASVLHYTSPVYAALTAALVLKERAPVTVYLGLLLAFCGTVLVTYATTQSETAIDEYHLGLIAGVASGIVGGIAMVTTKLARDDADVSTVFLSFSVVGLLLAAPSATPYWVPLTSENWLPCVLIGVLAAMAQTCFTMGLGFTSATLGSAMTQLVPVATWALSVVWLDERLSALAAGGAAMCMSGVFLAVAGRTQRDS